MSHVRAPVPLEVLDTPQDIGARVAARILHIVDAAASAGRRVLLGLPTGRTPRPVYESLAAQLSAAPRSLAHVTLVMMDEYLIETPDGFAWAIADGAPSCHAFTRREITGAINAVLTPAQQLRDAQVWFPDPRDPDAFEARITDADGIDFFLLASGAGDGHVAFNPPGSARESRTRIIALSEQTRRDNLVTFPALGTLDHVPRHGVSVGIATICEAREAVMVAWGEGKRETVRHITHATAYDPAWPATLIHECRNASILVDRAAAG